ncbi:hypothetical protein LXN10_11515 [Arcobacter sp. KX21116]|uniref:hypothetical protein n=1 Tax=Arcobacter iocasae TaxID=2906515 RepID=UPI0035D4A773
MKTMFVLFICISLLFALKVNNKTKEKEFKTKEEVNLIFSSIYKSNLEAFKKKN